MFKQLPRLLEGVPDAAGGGAAPAPAAGAAPAPAAPQNESLLTPPTAAPAAAAPAQPGAVPEWLPEKYRVVGTDGALDLQASSQKLAEGYAAASKRLGTGDVRPETADAYTYTPPEQFKDVPIDADLSASFRQRAHEAGLTQQQYEFVMGEYFGMVPSVLNAAASLTAEEARSALQQVWQQPGEFEAGLAAANRAVSAAPQDLRDKVFEKFGRDPDFIRFAATFGREMREDRAPAAAAAAPAAGGVEALMASDAYKNPKHPEHAAVSARVQQYFQRTAGAAPVL
ncbi:hypothetical protein [Pseudorhodoferax sp.]|uniref:hypothetical protein n=1 Tax=Pseudorhodoferax sp. TaxID=1993553 RepID=UPI0039E67809